MEPRKLATPDLPDLQARLDAAREVQMAPDEQEAQRRSFAFGNASIGNGRVTRGLVDRIAGAFRKVRP